MAVIGRLSIPISSDAGNLAREIEAPIRALEAMDKSAQRVQNSLSSIKAPAIASTGGEAAVAAATPAIDAGALAAHLRTALGSTSAPIEAMTQKLSTEFERVGGTVVTLARRIDSAMKFPQFNAALTTVRTSLVGFGTSGPPLIDGISHALVRASKALYPYSPLLSGITVGLNLAATAANVTFGLITRGASLATGAATALFQAYFRVHNFLSRLGDVAGKTFSQLFHLGTLGVFRQQAVQAEKFNSAVRSSPAAVTKLTGTIKGLGREVLIALGAFGLVYKAVGALKAGISGASTLNETVSKSKEVFGASGAVVTAMADDMAKRFGAVKAPLIEGANAIGLIGINTGQSAPQAAAMGASMTRLAADAARFHKVPLSDSLDKIEAGLRGNYGALGDFGVVLSDNAVKAEALRMGLAANGATLDDRTKVIARASLIEKGLAAASGEVARSQNTASGQWAKLQGNATNSAVALGQLLLPALTKAVETINEVSDTIRSAFETTGGSVIKSFSDSVVAAFDTIGVAARNYDLIWEIAKLKLREYGANFLAVLGTIPENLGIIGSYIANNWTKLIRDGFNAAIAVVTNFAANITNLGTAIGTWFADPLRGFEFNWTPLLDGFKATADKFPDLVKPPLISVQAEIDKVAAQIAAREKDRAKKLEPGPAAKAAPGAAAAAAAKVEAPKLASALQLGSKEAYSAIVKAQAPGGSNDIKEVASTAKKQLAVGEKMATSLTNIERIFSDGTKAPQVYGIG